MKVSEAKKYFYTYHRMNSKKKFLEKLSSFYFQVSLNTSMTENWIR